MVSKAVIIGGAVAGVIVITLVVLYGMYFSGFNGAQAKDENVNRLEGDVNVQLQRRYDLIPNIVSVAQTHLQFERSVLENVTRLRSDWQ
ncbi:MAG: LemA family protein, partial [Nitrososphaera sp.]